MRLLYLAAVLVLAYPGAAQPRPRDQVWFTGASNLRAFTCRSTSVGKTVTTRPDGQTAALLAGDPVLTEVAVEIPSGSFHCGIAEQNHHLRHTLRAREHPLIRFNMLTYDLEPGALPAVRIHGSLEVAGTRREVSMEAILRREADGSVRVAGSHLIRPSDFGIQPPRRFIGLLRVRDEVMVHFDVEVATGVPLMADEPAPAPTG